MPGHLLVAIEDAIDRSLAALLDEAGFSRAEPPLLMAADLVRDLAGEALADPRPSLIACRTIIGLGAPTKAAPSSSQASMSPQPLC